MHYTDHHKHGPYVPLTI